MLREVSPAVLVVSTRPDHIAPCAMAGLAAGCHLIVEKPLALDLPTLEALHAAARKAGRRVMAMLSMRGVPAFAAARQAVLGGRIGRPVLINTRKSYKWGQREEWFNERSKYGGTWPWIGIHNLDMAHFVTGLRPVKVMAAHSHAAHPNLPECEDVATAIFLLEGRVQMTASVDLCRPASAETWGDDWLRIVGTGGVIEANGSTGRVTILSAGAAVETIDAGIDPLPIYRDFLASLESADPAANAIAFQLTAAALVARDSADSGGPLPLDPGHWG
jgi:predicted dehydrogenase